MPIPSTTVASPIASGASAGPRAIQDFDEAIRLNPNHAKAFQNRGNAYKAKGDSERAMEDYNTAVRLNPKPPS